MAERDGAAIGLPSPLCFKGVGAPLRREAFLAPFAPVSRLAAAWQTRGSHARLCAVNAPQGSTATLRFNVWDYLPFLNIVSASVIGLPMIASNSSVKLSLNSWVHSHSLISYPVRRMHSTYSRSIRFIAASQLLKSPFAQSFTFPHFWGQVRLSSGRIFLAVATAFRTQRMASNLISHANRLEMLLP